jgi:hypothetical protein
VSAAFIALYGQTISAARGEIKGKLEQGEPIPCRPVAGPVTPTSFHRGCRLRAGARRKGQMKGFWAVTVRANWRVIFRFDDGATDVDYVDYH